MKFKSTVIVKLKDSVRDAKGQTISDVIKNAGYLEEVSCRAGSFYEITFDCENVENAKEKAEKLAKEVLSNPAIEVYTLTLERNEKKND